MAQPEELDWREIKDAAGYVSSGWVWGEGAKQRILRVRHGI